MRGTPGVPVLTVDATINWYENVIAYNEMLKRIFMHADQLDE